MRRMGCLGIGSQWQRLGTLGYQGRPSATLKIKIKPAFVLKIGVTNMFRVSLR